MHDLVETDGNTRVPQKLKNLYYLIFKFWSLEFKFDYYSLNATVSLIIIGKYIYKQLILNAEFGNFMAKLK